MPVASGNLKTQWGISPHFLPEKEKTIDDAGLLLYVACAFVLENQPPNGADFIRKSLAGYLMNGNSLGKNKGDKTDELFAGFESGKSIDAGRDGFSGCGKGCLCLVD